MEKRRILCVEKVQMVCGLIETVLEEYEVRCANTLERVQSLCRDRCFDLYLINPSLAEGDGTELVSWIRSSDPNAPILLLTGTHVEGWEDTFTGIVRKSSPGFVDELREKVESLLLR